MAWKPLGFAKTLVLGFPAGGLLHPHFTPRLVAHSALLPTALRGRRQGGQSLWRGLHPLPSPSPSLSAPASLSRADLMGSARWTKLGRFLGGL